MPKRYRSRRVSLAVLTISVVLLLASVVVLIPGLGEHRRGLLVTGALLALAGLFALRSTFRYSERGSGDDS